MPIDKKSSPIVIPIKADTSPFKKSLKDLEKSTKAWTDLLNGDKTKSTANKNIKNLNDTKKASDTLYASLKKHKDQSNSFEANTKGATSLGSVITNSIVPMRMMQQNMGGLIGKIERMLPGILALNYGFKNVISEAFQANQKTIEWHNSLSTLSDTSGNANAAIGQMTKGFFASAGSLEQVKGNMLSLVNEGISPASSGFNELTRFITNMSIATGIGAETFTNFSGILIRNWGSSVKATEQMTSSIMAMQKAFGSTASEITATMKTIGDVMEKMGSFFVDGERSAIALTKGISMAVGVMNKLGVSTQKSTEFMGKLLDPDQLSENMTTFHRLGVSTQEVFDMFTSADPKAMIFDKILDKLPELSKQIMSIQNPLARINFAKSVGIDLAIASKMAKATGGQVDKIKQEFKKAAEDTKAAEKKQSQMKADQQKFDDTLHLMKRDALEPMMKWVHENMGLFWTTAKYVFAGFKKYTTGMAGILNTIKTAFLPAFDVLTNGGGFGDFLSRLTDGVLTIFGKAVVKLWDTFIEYTPAIAKGVASAWTTMMKDHPVITSLITVATGMTMYNKVVGGIRDFITAFKGERGSLSNPMITQDIGSLGGKGGMIQTIKDMKGKIAGAATGVIGAGSMFFGKGITRGIDLGEFGGKISSGSKVAKTVGGVGAGAASSIAALVVGGILGGAEGYLNANKLMRENDYGMLSEKQFNELKAFDNDFATKKYKDELIKMGVTKQWDVINKQEVNRIDSQKLKEVSSESKKKGMIGGAASLGIAPLIDSLFNTQTTKWVAEAQSDYWGANVIPLLGPVITKMTVDFIKFTVDKIKSVGTQISDWWGSDPFTLDLNKNLQASRLMRESEKKNIEMLETKMKTGKKLTDEEYEQYKRLIKIRQNSIFEQSALNKDLKENSIFNTISGWLASFGTSVKVFDSFEEGMVKVKLEIKSFVPQFLDMLNQMSLGMQNWADDMIQMLKPDMFISQGDKDLREFRGELATLDVDYDNKNAKGDMTDLWNKFAKKYKGTEIESKFGSAFQSRMDAANRFDAGREKLREANELAKKRQEQEDKDKAYNETYLKLQRDVVKNTGITAKNTKEKPESKTDNSTTNWFDAFVGYNTAIKVTM